MTLIISCLTSDYLLQVSDRRLVNLDGSLFEDDANKSIIVEGHFSFAYTGLAYLENGTRTDEWFIDVFAKLTKSSDELLQEFSEKCNHAIRRITLPNHQKRLAFVGIGWSHFKTLEGLWPTYISISNFQSDTGRWKSTVDEEFKVYITNLPKNIPVKVFSAGQQLPDSVIKKLERNLSKCVARDVGPDALALLLIRGMRFLAFQNSFIGKNLMLTSIPKVAMSKKAFMAISDKPRKDMVSFLYIPQGKNEGVQYGPNFVTPGGVALKGFTARNLSRTTSVFEQT